MLDLYGSLVGAFPEAQGHLFPVKNNVVIPLVQPERCSNSQGQMLQESGTEEAAAEAEAVLIQI